MTATPSVSGFSSVVQAGWQQLRVQQARQDAAQAEQAARALGARAESAQKTANQAIKVARELSVQSDQANSNAGHARQGLAAAESADQMRAQLSSVADQVTKSQESAETSVPSAAPVSTTASPSIQGSNVGVVNTQGQRTGTVINTTA